MNTGKLARLFVTALIGLGLATGFTGQAHAASSWSAVSDLSAAGSWTNAPQMALSEDGAKTIAVWQRSDEVIQATTATVNGNKATRSAVSDISDTGQTGDVPQVALSADGTKAIAVWQRSDGTNTIIQAKTATIASNNATWSSTSDLSDGAQNAYQAQVDLSTDGTKAIAAWTRHNGTHSIIQAETATIASNNATWSAARDLSATGQSASAAQVDLSTDGTKAIAVWQRSNGTNEVVQAASADIADNSATWSSASDLSDSTQTSYAPAVALSTDGTKATTDWIGIHSGYSVIESRSATIASNNASWGSTSHLSSATANSTDPQLAMSGDGTKAIGMWANDAGANSDVRVASATIDGSNATWTAAAALSAPQIVDRPRIAISADGTRSTSIWRRFNGSKYVVQSTSAMVFVPAAPTLDFTGDTLSITPAADTGGSPITSYAILYNTQARIDTNKAWATWATWWPLGTTSIDLATYRTIAACTPVAATATPTAGKCYRAIGEQAPGDTFTYQVAAINANGRSTWATQAVTRPALKEPQTAPSTTSAPSPAKTSDPYTDAALHHPHWLTDAARPPSTQGL